MERKQLIDMANMRTKAWVAKVGMVRGTESTPLTPVELMGATWGKAGYAFRFDKWVSGKNHVSDTALKLVETELAAMKLPSCIDVYKNGPEGLPFWTLLSDAPESYPEDVCRTLITDYLYRCENGMETKWVASVNKPFTSLVEDLWNRLMGRIPVDFSAYDSGEEGNALRLKFEREQLTPSLELFAILLAVRQLAERRRECRDLARYLSGACRPMLDLFAPWNISKDVGDILRSWYAPSNPVSIAMLDDCRDQSAYCTPERAGAEYASYLKTVPD